MEGKKKTFHTSIHGKYKRKKKKEKELHCTIVEDIFAVCPKRDGQHLPCLQS